MRAMRGVRALGFVAASIACIAACGPSLVLHAPSCAPAEARAEPTRVEIAPIETRASAVVPFASPLGPPAPGVVLTSGIANELRARALHGGEPGGYEARCLLERFALRAHSDMSETATLSTLYVDLTCEVKRLADRAPVWRGALRARAATRSSSMLSADTKTLQRMADRMMSDATRELASDLALRALALTAEPSHRVFADEQVERELAGLDDSAYGPAALSENPKAVASTLAAISGADAEARAAGWNVAAMAAGPGDPWMAGDRMRLDDDSLVRFHQYKALARLSSSTSLGELRAALAREEDPLLAELVRDSLASGGIGLARSPRARASMNASAVTNGSTTSP
jgi:hypothetical protein